VSPEQRLIVASKTVPYAAGRRHVAVNGAVSKGPSRHGGGADALPTHASTPAPRWFLK